MFLLLGHFYSNAKLRNIQHSNNNISVPSPLTNCQTHITKKQLEQLELWSHSGRTCNTRFARLVASRRFHNQANTLSPTTISTARLSRLSVETECDEDQLSQRPGFLRTAAASRIRHAYRS